MRLLLVIAIMVACSFSLPKVYSQTIKDCPSYPAVNYFDSICLTKIGNSEILLGQGRVRHPDLWGDFIPTDVYVPSNRPIWAIAQVHGWHLIRNILKYEPYDKHMFAGTMMKESYLGCDGGISFAGIPAPFTYSITASANFQPANALNIRDGCFHIDKFTGTQGVLMKYYPHRFSNLDLHHGDYVGGSNYERAIISKVMYDVILFRLREYSDGLDPNGVLGNAADPFAGEIYTALSYNKGFNDGRLISVLDNPARRATAISSGNWLTLNVGSGSFGYDYTNATSLVVKVLSNNNYTGTPVAKPLASYNESDNQWHNWYDYLYTWAEVESYLDKLLFMYPEANPTIVKNKVRKAFDAQKDASNRVSFRYKFGPVLDAIILALPYDDPMPIILASTAGVDQCAGKVGPVVKITPTLPTVVCNGQSVQLSTIAGTGYTYQWKRNGINIANPSTPAHIFYATTTGAYSVVVTTSSGAVIPSECSIDVTVENCSSCSMAANAIVTNNSCTGKTDGSATISLSNTSGQLPVIISWSGKNTGTAVTSLASYDLTGLSEGTYQIEIVSQNNPTCKAFTTARLTENVKLNQSVDVNSVITSCNSATLTASIANVPPPTCNYRLQLYENSGSPWWDHSYFRLDLLANGASLGPMRPRKKVWNDPVWLDTLFTVPHNQEIRVTLNNITTTSQMAPNFSLRLYHPDGTIAFTQNLNGVNYPVNVTTIRTLTSNCQEAMPSYAYSWSPTTGLSSTNTLVTNASVPPGGVTYTFKATHPDPSKAGCILSKSVFVEETCTPLSTNGIKLYVIESDSPILHWTIERSNQVSIYEVQMSSNGQDYETIFSTQQSSYPLRGRTGFFRVISKEENFIKVSNSVSVVDKRNSLSFSPNPSATAFALIINDQIGDQLEDVFPANVYDSFGKLIEQIQLKRGVEIGINWKPGVYNLVVLDSARRTKVLKLIKY